MQIEEATIEINKEINESITDEDRDANIRFKGRRPRFNFFDMGIEKGSKLTLAKGNNPVEVFVESENKVSYNGSEYALNPLTKELLGINYKILALEYWKYGDKLLQDIYNELYPVEEE